MKNQLASLFFLFISVFGFAQGTQDYRIIPSITDWIEEVNNWPEKIYSVSRIKILVDPIKDKNYIGLEHDLIVKEDIDTIPRKTLNKAIIINDFQFGDNSFRFSHVAIKNIHFKEDVKIFNLLNGRLAFKNCVFDKLHQVRVIKTLFHINYYDCTFNGIYRQNNPEEPLNIEFYRCNFNDNCFLSSDQGIPNLVIVNSTFQKSLTINQSSTFNSINIKNSTILGRFVNKQVQIKGSFEFISSKLGNFNIDGTSLPIENTYIPFKLISNKIALSYQENPEIYNATIEKSFEDKESYDRLIAMYAKLLAVYKARSESESYNACYVEMRKKQTAYSKFLYSKNKSFSNYIVYQLNKFMEIFSDYGTKPTKAIIFSIYVILLFALIYLFFPNSWDKHGKNRIVNRYNFFFKYMKRKAGIHEVYLEEQNDELMSYDQFKENISTSKQKVPKFFTATALPLYKWAISGTKLSASILKRVDIMKGSWSELPQSKRIWKSILLIGAFTVAICYDILIKMLNALMLSINTFTTLGFGEIPIKGLPRYLAIIQGFIGWFMLTIFSVSLISQLLN